MTVSKEASGLGSVWQNAVVRYQETTKVDLGSLAQANSVEDILIEINKSAEKFGRKRHDNSKLDRFRSLVSDSLLPIQVMTEMVSQVLSDAFPPSSAIFTAVRYLIRTANRVSADYDRLSEFFQDLMFYLNCFRTIDVHAAPELGLDAALAAVLASVLDLCGICAKYTKTSRIVKAWRNLAGYDRELAHAYSHFHKMVDRARCKVTLASGVGVSDLHQNMRGLKRADTLESLSTHDVLTIQKEKFTQHQTGTCEWVLHHEAFQMWLTGMKDSTLWCYGDHGSGKTILTSFLINFLSENTQGSNTAIAYIYCNYKDNSTHLTDELLSSISRQLAEQVHHLPSVLKEFRDQNATKKRKPKGEEWIALIQSLRDYFSRAIIIVDALDECPDLVKDELLDFLQLLDTSVRFIFTSRPHIDFPVHFAGLKKIRIAADPLDLRVFLEAEISKNRRFQQKVIQQDDVLQERIVHEIIMKSRGMFLLARLHVGKICSQLSKAAVIKTLNCLPEDIFQYYHEAIQRIEQQDEVYCNLAKQVISFISHAKRPLHVQELRHALAVLPNDTNFDESQCVDHTLLVSLCAGLVQVDVARQIVEFVHYTFQEYCETFPSKILEDFHSKMAEVCLVYLSFDQFSSGPCLTGNALEKRLTDHAFLSYAAQHWGHHMRASGCDHTQLALAYLKSPRKLSSGIQALYATSRRPKNWFDQYPKEVGPLHMASYWGLESLITFLLGEGHDPGIRTTYGETSLLLAAQNDHLGAAKLLLDHGVDVDEQGYSGESALSLAARKGSEDLVRFLLSSGANLISDEEGWTAINWAILCGNTAALKLILAHEFEQGIEMEMKDKGLFLASEEGRLDMVRALLDSGADRNAKDDYGSSVLDFAVSGGHDDIVRELLLDTSNIDSADSDGNTALHWAVPQYNIVALLLDHGAPVNHQNDAGQTALHWAAHDGLTEVANLLLARDANPNTQDKNGATALHSAALQGRVQIVDLLLKRGADKRIEDVDGWTPFYSAAVEEHLAVCDLLSDKSRQGECSMNTITQELSEPNNWMRARKLANKKSQGSTALTGLRVAAQEGQLGRLQTMLDRGADINTRDPAGYTALEVAVYQRRQPVVQFLLESGANPDLRGSVNCTPLHVAVEGNQPTMVKMLIEHGADVNIDTYGTTPLMIAARLGANFICEILLAAKADAHSRDIDGKTALQMAVLHKSKRVEQLLLEAGAVPEESETTVESEAEDLDPEIDFWGSNDTIQFTRAFVPDS